MNIKMTAPRTRSFSFYRLPRASSNTTAEILHGLRLPQKTIDPKFFYDAHGSQLYEKITKTFDYYVTRAEEEILRRYMPAIAAAVGTDAVVIEPGAGSCRKIEYLLDGLRPSLYVPIDISATTLESACSRLMTRYEWLPCFGIGADFDQLDRIDDLLPKQRRIVFFPGSTIGNFEPENAARFLRRLRKLVQPDGGLLIGVDNVKDVDVLERAYDDRGGITAAFNKNMLNHINRIAPANFDTDAFEHRAVWNSEKSRIEMHLVSRADQVVEVADRTLHLKAGETLHTENSYKYTRASFRALAAEAGFQCAKIWHDQRDYFTLYYFQCDPHTLIGEHRRAISSFH